MIGTLPTPEVVRCYFEETFDPHLPAMSLRWPLAEDVQQVWQLPEEACFHGPPPRFFGIRIERQADDCYAVELLWNRTRLSWSGLPRHHLLSTDLTPLLAALGTDLWYLLDQPLTPDGSPRRAA